MHKQVHVTKLFLSFLLKFYFFILWGVNIKKRGRKYLFGAENIFIWGRKLIYLGPKTYLFGAKNIFI